MGPLPGRSEAVQKELIGSRFTCGLLNACGLHTPKEPVQIRRGSLGSHFDILPCLTF